MLVLEVFKARHLKPITAFPWHPLAPVGPQQHFLPLNQNVNVSSQWNNLYNQLCKQKLGNCTKIKQSFDPLNNITSPLSDAPACFLNQLEGLTGILVENVGRSLCDLPALPIWKCDFDIIKSLFLTKTLYLFMKIAGQLWSTKFQVI